MTWYQLWNGRIQRTKLAARYSFNARSVNGQIQRLTDPQVVERRAPLVHKQTVHARYRGAVQALLIFLVSFNASEVGSRDGRVVQIASLVHGQALDSGVAHKGDPHFFNIGLM